MNKIAKTADKKAAKKKTVPAEPELSKEENTLGLVGSHPEATRFRGLVKANGQKISEVLLGFIREYNKNKTL